MEQVFRCFVEKRPGFQVEAENSCGIYGSSLVSSV